MNIEKFSDLVGNILPISLIKKGINKKTLPQFLLLSGECGVGKSSVAELTAMAVTCENPHSGEACGICESCLSNKAALGKGGGGISSHIEKVNMAKVAKERSMLEQIRSTFQIIRSDGIYVKIFEEFHSLPENEQRLMLEETSRIPENVYVILTTTRKSYILKEIVSRCLVFNFGRLSQGECAVLVDRVNKSLHLKKDDYKLIYRKTDGIPRNIVVLIEFLSRTDPTKEEINHLLGNIDNSIFIDIFSNISDFRLYLEDIELLQVSYAPEIILNQLKNFIMQVVFALEGQIYESLSKRDLSKLLIKDIGSAYKIVKILEATKEDKQDLDIMFLKIRHHLMPPMSLSEQHLTASVSSSIQKNKIQTPAPVAVKTLKRFDGGIYNESSNG